MGVDIETYRGRIGTFRFSSGANVGTVVCLYNLNGETKVIGAVVFIGTLLLLAGIEPNPGPKENDEEQKNRTIRVTGIPDDVGEQQLSLVFKNYKKSGGGKISQIKFHEESHSAIIQFEDPATVDSVLQKRPIKIYGSVIEVDIEDDSFDCEASSNRPICTSSTVEVTGLETDDAEKTSEDLELYFEDEESSGGDSVVAVKILNKEKALITFESIEVAQRVVNRSKHTLKQNNLIVLPHHEENAPEIDVTTESSTLSMEYSPGPVARSNYEAERSRNKVDIADILVEVQEPVTDDEIKDKAKVNMEKILGITGLRDKFPGKITVMDIMSIDLEANSKKNYTTKEMPWNILRRILGVQSNARDIIALSENTEKAKKTEDDGDDIKMFELFLDDDEYKECDTFCPLDVFQTVIQCCDPMLKQLLFKKLYLCKVAFPFLHYHMPSNNWELVLWPFRSLIVESFNTSESNQTDTNEFEILELPVKTVTFANFDRPDCSKSKIANDLLSEEIEDTFFNVNCPHGMAPKCISRGSVEMFILPSTSLKESIFEEPLTFFNMRGRIEGDFTTDVTNFISKISDVLVLILDKSVISTYETKFTTIITQFPAVIIVIANPLDQRDKITIKEFIERLPTSLNVRVVSTYKRGTKVNPKEFSALLKKVIRTQLSALKVKSLDDRFKECSHTIINDEITPECGKGKDIASQIFHVMDVTRRNAQWKSLITPVHYSFSKHLGASIRKLHRVKDVQDTHHVVARIKKLRQEQLKNISNAMKLFIQKLDEVKVQPMVLQYLTQWLSIFLERQKRKQLPYLVNQKQTYRQRLTALQSQASPNEIEMKELAKKFNKSQEIIEDANFGLEHIFREVGHIYDSLLDLKEDPETVELPPVQNIVHVIATLIVKGQTFELIDGDNFYLPFAWVGKVFEQLSLDIKSKKNLTLSVLGVQSTGKSTLLNSLFGSLFPVKSGRCTRGIHMQMMPILSKSSLPFDYVTVIDSEGLRSTDSTSQAHNHDNELSTVIAGLGDITLLNVMGENTNDIRDILQVVVHAFLKLKLANKHLDIGKLFYLVHQNVIDTLAQSNMRMGLIALTETLDEATKNAGEAEGIHDIKTFHQVIDFDIGSNIWYLPSYWQGNPPMARVNSAYSTCVFDKRSSLLKKALNCKDKSYRPLTDIAVHIRDLWKGVLTENFVFSFRNSLEIKTYIHMEETLKDILINFEDTIENRYIISAQKHFSECCNHRELSVTSESLLNQMRKFLSDKKSCAMCKIKEYFENNEYKDIILQWEDFAKKRIESLYLELDDRMKTETIRLRERKRIELTINENSLVHETNLYDRSIQVAKSMKGQDLNMEEIDDKFEQIWEQLSSEILSHSELEDVLVSLASTFEKCLFDIFSTEQLILKSELENRRGMNQQEQTGEQCDNSTNFLHMDTLKGSFDLSKIALDDISFSYEWSRFENELKITRIKDEVIKIFDKVESDVAEFLRDKDDVSYREVKQILNKVYKKIKLLQNQEHGFSLKITGVVKLCIHMTSFCATKFDAHNVDYHKTRGILARVTNYKIQVREQFIAYIKNRKAEETAAKQITIIFENILWDTMKERIRVTVKIALKQTLPNLKFHLILEVLQDLTETDDFESFVQYIKAPRKFVKQWVKRKAKDYLFGSNKAMLSEIVKKIVNGIYDDIKESIDKSDKHFSSIKTTSAINWTESFVKNLSNCPVKTNDFQNVTKWFCQIEDIKNFSRLLSESIDISTCEMESRALQNAENLIRFNGPESSVKNLFEQAWGCPEQCAFCGEPCAKGFVHSGTNHYSLQHRVLCCNGAREEFTNKVVLSSCNFNVQSDLLHHCDLFGFRCNKDNKSSCEEDYHVFKDYKVHLPDWDIEPNANMQECSKFWLWFVAKYKNLLAIHYYYDISDIPDAWGEITETDALANLRRIYSV